MTRDGSTHFDSDVCTPDDFAQMRPAIERVGRDVRAEVIVKSTLVETSHVAAFSPAQTPSRRSALAVRTVIACATDARCLNRRR